MAKVIKNVPTNTIPISKKKEGDNEKVNPESNTLMEILLKKILFSEVLEKIL